jgi:hypothetical protein
MTDPTSFAHLPRIHADIPGAELLASFEMAGCEQIARIRENTQNGVMGTDCRDIYRRPDGRVVVYDWCMYGARSWLLPEGSPEQ